MAEDSVKIRLTISRDQYNALMHEADGRPLAPMLVRWITERLDSGVSAPSDTRVLTFDEPEVEPEWTDADVIDWINANPATFREHGPDTTGMSDEGRKDVLRAWVRASHHRF